MQYIYVLAAGVLLGLAAVAHAQESTALQWTERAPLPEGRTEVSVTTDGERIFLAGGFGPPRGAERASAPRTLWAYSPRADRWDSIGELPEGVHHAAFVHHRGRLYLLGGFRETSFEPVGSVHIYDIASGEWSAGASMPVPRGAAGFTVLNGRIHVIGGNVASRDAVAGIEGVEVTDDRSVNLHEAYDPATDSWTRLAPMPTPRNQLGAAANGGRIHAVLGRADGFFLVTAHEIYHAATDRWEAGPAVPTGRSGVAVVAHDGHIYAFGGENLGEGERRTFDTAERFDTATGRWEALPPMPTARHGLGAAVYQGGIHVISGGPEPALAFGTAHERLAPAQ